jgi:hypothetical protein
MGLAVRFRMKLAMLSHSSTLIGDKNVPGSKGTWQWHWEYDFRIIAQDLMWKIDKIYARLVSVYCLPDIICIIN